MPIHDCSLTPHPSFSFIPTNKSPRIVGMPEYSQGPRDLMPNEGTDTNLPCYATTLITSGVLNALAPSSCGGTHLTPLGVSFAPTGTMNLYRTALGNLLKYQSTDLPSTHSVSGVHVDTGGGGGRTPAALSAGLGVGPGVGLSLLLAVYLFWRYRMRKHRDRELEIQADQPERADFSCGESVVKAVPNVPLDPHRRQSMAELPSPDCTLPAQELGVGGAIFPSAALHQNSCLLYSGDQYVPDYPVYDLRSPISTAGIGATADRKVRLRQLKMPRDLVQRDIEWMQQVGTLEEQRRVLQEEIDSLEQNWWVLGAECFSRYQSSLSVI
ncbi:hypothetical protein BJ170DRAFT_597021 [Xylariales sp. AK1849]|nr:hypothetical protein BJ170DRAFT_597021 [Xylariales sp. AK1849]